MIENENEIVKETADMLGDLSKYEDITAMDLYNMTITELKDVLNEVILHISSSENDKEKLTFSHKEIIQKLNILKFTDIDILEDYLIFSREIENTKDVFFNTLHHLLKSEDKNRTKLYLAKYLTPIDPPTEMAFNEDFQDLIEQYRILQGRFTESHKEWSASKESVSLQSVDISNLGNEVKSLSEQKLQLSESLTALASSEEKQNNSEFELMLKICKKLGKADISLENLKNEEEIQMEELKAFEENELKLMEEINLKRNLFESKETKEDTLEKVTTFLNNHNQNLQKELKQEMRKKDNLIEEISVLDRDSNKPKLSEEDIQNMKKAKYDLKAEISELEEKLDELSKNTDFNSILKMHRQQSSVLDASRANIQKKLKTVSEKVENTKKEIADLKKSISSLDSTKPIIRQKDFEEFAKQLRSKTVEFKEKKAKIDTLNQELVVLLQTEETLKEKCKNVKSAMKLVEKEEEEETVKFGSKEEIFQSIRNLELSITELKIDLKPEQDRLNELNKDVENISKVCRKKKKTFENVAFEYEKQKETKAKVLKNVLEATEKKKSELMKLEYQIECLQVRKLIVENTEEALTGHNIPSRLTVLEGKSVTLEGAIREIRKNAKVLDESSTEDAFQMKLFSDLANFMNIRLKNQAQSEISEEKQNNANYLKI